ncbi:putative xanthine dehydrogenase subunit A [Gimesia alba]|uniref:Putative xanthine dehydrogenase subunit A n=1 Tax=Gimesia alba TaxID=2527973 RepID=A0A517RPV5_9PLAN|nr:XdhC/CoxI family protein [Gimesia alba]QDT45908.1 putative xanthine dehydrogenase subunit A [Gimesia alba]
MRELLLELEQAVQQQKPVCYTCLVETRGSTPQKPGAAMLIFRDGSQAGTLGGGCVEAEVKRRALRMFDADAPEIMTFQLDSDYGWDDGLICGGRMKVLVDPIKSEADLEYYKNMMKLLEGDQGCTEAVVINPETAAGGSETDRYLIDANSKIVAWRGQPEPPSQLWDGLKPIKNRPRPYVNAGIAYLTFLQTCQLVIVGCGHIGQKVAALASDVGFEIIAVDDRQEYCNPERFPDAKQLIVGSFDTVLSDLTVNKDTFIIIVTRGHNHDEEALGHLAQTEARYIGMIGSKRKVKLIFEDLLRTGTPREALAKVHAPLGFDIGSQTVPEIALSIVAELVAYRNLDSIPAGYQRPSLVEEIKTPGQSG